MTLLRTLKEVEGFMIIAKRELAATSLRGPTESTESAWQAGSAFLTWFMRPMRSLFLYMGMIFLGAALLSPWVYWLAQCTAKLSPSFARLGTQPFHRYVH